MRALTRWSGPILLTAIVVSACGGGGGDPSAAVKTYLNAVASGDGSTACKQIDTQTISQVIRGAGSNDPSACAKIISQASKLISPAQKKELQSAQASTTSTSGNTAKVKISLAGRARTVTLTKSNGNWLISGAPGAAG